jgi:hypothetical protein
MKSTIISMLIVLGLMVAVPMFIFNDGDMMSEIFGGGGDGKESIAALKAKAPKNVANVSVKKEVKMYKWVDEFGVTQFSQTPPRDGGASQEMTLKPQLNTMQKPYMPPKEAATEQAAPAAGFTPGNPYNPAKMKEMMQQSRALQKQINSQTADRKAMMDQMMKK